MPGLLYLWQYLSFDGRHRSWKWVCVPHKVQQHGQSRDLLNVLRHILHSTKHSAVSAFAILFPWAFLQSAKPAGKGLVVTAKQQQQHTSQETISVNYALNSMCCTYVDFCSCTQSICTHISLCFKRFRQFRNSSEMDKKYCEGYQK